MTELERFERECVPGLCSHPGHQEECVTALCAECGEELDPEVPEAHVCYEAATNG